MSENKDFLMFSGVVEMKLWAKMGQWNFYLYLTSNDVFKISGV